MAKEEKVVKKEKAIKNLYKIGVKNVGEEKTKQGLRQAFNGVRKQGKMPVVKKGTSDGYMVGGSASKDDNAAID